MRYINFTLYVSLVLLNPSLLACQAATSAPIKSSSQSKQSELSKWSTVDDDNKDGHGAKSTTADEALSRDDDTNAYAIESWDQSAITSADTDLVYVEVWAKSPWKDSCPILALSSIAKPHLLNYSARSANSSDGWGVAYDVHSLSNAYGVANKGIVKPTDQLYRFENIYIYDNGTELTYGQEKEDSGGKWIAYLTLGSKYSPTDVYCLYSIWSQKSERHLQDMIYSLRIVTP
ncbi:hypothetical protein [Psychrobacter fozii]|uniref:hypothetical protein n=1 Tax=Psychrobacter fozii TaxID=198480 RepID=UPI001918F5B3|nr:hypothetical protein [Psychrobacter fozii]